MSDAIYSGNETERGRVLCFGGNGSPILTCIRITWTECSKWTAGLWLRVLDSEALESLGICITNKFLENAGAAGLRALLQELLVQEQMNLKAF